jgi:hypothetical protein
MSKAAESTSPPGASPSRRHHSHAAPFVSWGERPKTALAGTYPATDDWAGRAPALSRRPDIGPVNSEPELDVRQCFFARKAA